MDKEFTVTTGILNFDVSSGDTMEELSIIKNYFYLIFF